MDLSSFGIRKYFPHSINHFLPDDNEFLQGVFSNALGKRNFTHWNNKFVKSFPHSVKYLFKKSICFEDYELFFKLTNKKSFDINCILDEEKERSPLILACILNHHFFVKYLILKGCDIEKKDIFGFRAIDYCFINFSFESMKILLENGCQIDIKDKYDYTLEEKIKNKKSNFLYELFKIHKNERYWKFIDFNLNLKTQRSILPKYSKKEINFYPFNNFEGNYVIGFVDNFI